MIPKGKRPRDPNQLAAMIVALSTGEAEQEPDERNPAAVALGRSGGLKGGKARADGMTPERRKEIAVKAAASRWKRNEES